MVSVAGKKRLPTMPCAAALHDAATQKQATSAVVILRRKDGSNIAILLQSHAESSRTRTPMRTGRGSGRRNGAARKAGCLGCCEAVRRDAEAERGPEEGALGGDQPTMERRCWGGRDKQ